MKKKKHETKLKRKRKLGKYFYSLFPSTCRNNLKKKSFDGIATKYQIKKLHIQSGSDFKWQINKTNWNESQCFSDDGMEQMAIIIAVFCIRTLTCSSSLSFRRCVCSSSLSTYSRNSSISSFTCCTVSNSCLIATISRLTCEKRKNKKYKKNPLICGKRLMVQMCHYLLPKLRFDNFPRISLVLVIEFGFHTEQRSFPCDDHPAGAHPISDLNSYSSR